MFCRLLIILWIASAVAPACRAEIEVTNANCPVEPSEAALPEYSADFDGKKVYFCCSECIEMFNADPQKYLAQGEADPLGVLGSGIGQLWNLAARTPGLSLGALVLAALLAARLSIPSLRPLLGAQVFTIGIALALGAEALCAHRVGKQEAAKREEAALRLLGIEGDVLDHD